MCQSCVSGRGSLRTCHLQSKLWFSVTVELTLSPSLLCPEALLALAQISTLTWVGFAILVVTSASHTTKVCELCNNLGH